MSELAAHGAVPLYRALDRTQWKALVASNLGWTFDGFEVFALILTVGVALHQLLDPSQYQFIPAYAGAVIAITVFGWGLGGLLGGVLADYLGRKRSMTLTILAYSLLTGLSAFAWDWLSFGVLRFLVGLAIGSEWATGASITAELWPAKARGKGGAFLQSGYPIGSILACGVWLFVSSSAPGPSRSMLVFHYVVALLRSIQPVCALICLVSFVFLADHFGRKQTTILYYLMCLILTPLLYLGIKDVHLLVAAFAVYGFFIQGWFSWTPIWLPELFPTRMRATAAGFIFNAPRLISAIAPLIAGTLIVGLGGYGKAATIIGMFYILGLLAAPFLPETKGAPLPEADTLSHPQSGHQPLRTA